MAPATVHDVPVDAPPPPGPGPRPRRRGRWLWRALLGLAVVLVVAVVAGLLWFFFGRDQASEVSTDRALEDLRSSGAATGGGIGGTAGLPAVGVYAATATGSEDIGLPGMTESFGPGAPVTVTHGGGGCFTYRVDLNSHHSRSWTFCPSGDATFALTTTDSATRRDVPGLDLDSLATYRCDMPVPYLWPDPVVGEQRSGSCTGESDVVDGVTGDAGTVEVLGLTTLTVDGTEVPVVHVRSTDTFTDAQVGTEVDEWWLDAATGLPLRIVIDCDLTSSAGDYRESGTVELTSLVPAT